MHKKEVIATGKSVEEAIASAKAELNVTTEDIGFEILDLPKRGFLGFGRTPAKVRVYVEIEDPAPERTERPARPARPEQPNKTNAPVKAEQPKKAEKAQPAEKSAPAEKTAPAEKASPAEKNVSGEKPAEHKSSNNRNRRQRQRSKPAAPRTDAAPSAAPAAQAVPEVPEAPFVDPATLSEKTQLAVRYVSDVLAAMGVKEASLRARESEDHIELLLEGADLGVVIGRRGETLDALQYLTSLVANRLDGDYTRISIDSGDYRKKRAETLERLAHKLARNAVRTGRSTKLEPMNPYERRIIHAAVSHVEGATSSSIGEEPNRRVVISSKTPRRRNEDHASSGRQNEGAERTERSERGERSERNDRGDRGGRRRRGGSGPRPTGPRPDSSTAPAQRVNDADIEIPAELMPKEIPAPHPVKKVVHEAHTPTEEEKSVLPLYGRLDIEDDETDE